jgi:alpha-ketoglutarate-dependent taurine dioxygenase
MIHISPIDFTSINEISNNIDFYKNLFTKDGILIFRDANLSHEEHMEFHNMLKNNFGWYLNAENYYTEDHSRLTTDSLRNITDNNKVMLPWHVEHPHYSNPIVAATWNMHKFNTDPENGKTFFVDMEKLFISMSDEYKNFAKQCIISNTYKDKTYNLIGHHWINNNPVIRMSYIFEDLTQFLDLVTVNGKIPTEDDINLYKNMMYWIQKEITTNLDIRIVHKWKQGDIVMPDMYKMCHAVTGGFDSQDREFTGIWGHQSSNFEKIAFNS